MTHEKPLWNPYVAGVFLGLVLLASFVVLGFGLGASGGINRFAIAGAATVAPDALASRSYFAAFLDTGRSVLDDWLVFELVGVFVGGLLGAYSAGRLRRTVEKGPRARTRTRLVLAILGGVAMGYAARLAHGCTSGQALTGGALLSLGSWIFMLSVFAGGYLVAPLVKRQWLPAKEG